MATTEDIAITRSGGHASTHANTPIGDNAPIHMAPEVSNYFGKFCSRISYDFLSKKDANSSPKKKTIYQLEVERINAKSEGTADADRWTHINKIMGDFLDKHSKNTNFDSPQEMCNYVLNFIENFNLFFVLLSKCENRRDFCVLAITMSKICFKGSIMMKIYEANVPQYINDIWDSLTSNEVQSGNPFSEFRDIITKYDDLKNTAIYKKIYKLLMYILTLSLFDKVGFTMDNFNFGVLQQETMRRKYYIGFDFYMCIVDTVTFICERGYEYYRTREVSSIICDPGKYGEWFDNFNKLKGQFIHINDPEPFKFTESSFLALLDDTLEKGHSILKHSYSLDSYQQKYISNKVSELHTMRDDLYSKRHCREDRVPPFSILVSGDSGIGKSTIKDILFYYFAKIQKLEADSSMRYTRNALANFWDGFTTSQWCIVMDDISSIHVAKAPNGDPSLMEVLQIVNQVAYVPDQASLNDKGRTPMRPKLVIGTTNTENLNANAYFSCPSAAQRRFPYIIVPEVREEFRTDAQMLDSAKVEDTEAYPDYWTWTVKRVKPRFGKDRKNLAISETILDKADIVSFLGWYKDAIRAHDDNQNKVTKSISNIKTMELCECHDLPMRLCPTPKEYPVESGGLIKKLQRISIKRYILKRLPLLLPLLYFSYLIFFGTLFYFIWLAYFLEYLHIKYITCICAQAPYYFNAIDFAVRANEITMKYLNKRILHKEFRDTRAYWENLPKKMELYSKRPATLVTIAAVCAFIGVAYKTYKKSSTYVMQGVPLSKESEKTEKSVTAVVPTSKDVEKENPWFKTTFNISEIPLSNKILTSGSMDFNSFLCKIGRNCCFASVRDAADSAGTRLRLTGIGGIVYMTNNHNIPSDGPVILSILCLPRTDGVTTNVRITLRQADILRSPENDLCFFAVSSLPTKASLLEYFADDLIRVRSNAKMIARGIHGELEMRDVKCLTAIEQYKTPVHTGNVYFGHCSSSTQSGDCGSLVVMDSPRGRIITSLHLLGTDLKSQAKGIYTSHSIQVTKTIIHQALDHFRLQSCGSEPISLSSESASRSLTELHFKSPFRYIENGVAEVYGSFAGFRRANKSRVMRTPMFDYLYEHGFEEKYTKPLMSGYLPWRVALLDMVKPHESIDSTALSHCVDSFFNDIVGKISDDIKTDVLVYSDFTAINGAAGVTYVDLMKRSTSAGNPWKKKKIFFLEDDTPQHGLQEPVKATEEIMERVREIESSYRRGNRVYPNFCAHLKDEPVTFAKREAGKTRVFTGAPMDFSIVNRKYFLSIIRLMQRNRFIFECGPGTISQSTEWDEIYHYLTTFSDEHIVAGDYKSFDKHMHPEFMLAAFDIIYKVCEHSGNYDEEDLRAISTMAMDVTYPYVDYNGDLVQFVGVNPSGHPLTVIINGLVNCLYIRYVYYMLNPKRTCSDFKENVKLMTYGDDNIMGINPDIPWFNHTTIRSALSTFGVVYTMADKTAVSVPYIKISEASFLKRTWRYDRDVGYYLCPLDEESIERSLMTWVLSKTIGPDEQCSEIIRSASEEYFWYGKEKFLTKKKLLQDLISHLSLELWFEDQPLNTWYELHKRYREMSGLGALAISGESLRIELRDNEQIPETLKCFTPNVQLQSSYWEKARCTCQLQNGECSHSLQERSSKLVFTRVPVDAQKYKNSTRNDLVSSFKTQISQSNVNKNTLPYLITAKNRDIDAKVQEFLTNGNFPIQSDNAHESKAASNSQYQNVGFSDDMGGMEMSMSDTTDYMNIDDSTNIDLGDFLSRPVNIFTYDWSEGVTPHFNFDPWALYFSKSSIRRKLDHYYMLRCNLHLKVVVNASPFYYGAALMSYRPLESYNPANVDINPLIPQTALVSRSQRPHIYLYPTNSQGGEMILPFISEKQWLDATSIADLTNMGRISVDGLTPLLNANSVTGSSATVQVFAWAENVCLAGPTTSFALQSSDEYADENGPVSGVASAVANYADKVNDTADKLSTVTGGLSLVIKPFATATSLASGAISSIAKLFGYTNVPVIDNVHAFKPQPFPQFASPHIGTPVEKLTLDPKNELTIDPCVSGVKMEDELAISKIVTRESYLTQFSWDSSDTENTVIFNSVVDPTLCQRDVYINNTVIAGTPMWYVAKAFSYWRGDITFRFKFLCTQYHRGRVRISWDPAATISTEADPMTEIYTQVIDITKDTDVEFTVPYTQTLPFKQVWQSNIERYSSTTAQAINPLFDNGQLTVSVLTKQTSPVVSADIRVAVFVKGSPNMQFAAPRELDNLLCQYEVQGSGLEYDDPERFDIGVDSNEETTNLNLLYMGERVRSLRELMRRSQYSYSICDVTQNINRSTLKSLNRRIPLLPGFDPNGISNAIGTFSTVAEGYNFVNWTYLTWFSQAFVGNRGSIIWHANLDTRQESGQLSIARNNSTTLSQAGYRTMVSTGDQDRSALSRYYLNNLSTGQTGMTLTNQHTQAGVSALVPLYSQYKFLSNDHLTRTLGDSSVDNTANDGVVFNASFINNNDTTEDYNLHLYTCAGTDYNPIFFLNVPTFYEYQSQPSSAPL